MSDINIQTFSGKVSVKNDLRVGQGHLFVDTAANQVGLNSLTPQANLHVTGNTYVTSDLRVGSGIVMDQKVATFGTTKTFVVQVVGGVFEIDGVSRPALTFHESQTYIFDQSHNSNGGHPIAFSEAVNGGTPYTTGVTSTGTPGQANAKTTFKVPVGAPSTLYYYCVNHPSTMGSLSSAPSVVRTDAEIIVSGRLLASSFHGDGANLNNIPASAINGTLSQWVTTGNDIYYSTGGVAIGSSQAPTSTLDVTGSGAFSTTLSVGGSGAFGGDLTVGTDKLFVDVSTGQVGVGTTTPAAGKALDVVGDFQATYLYGDGSNISNITSSQWVTTGTDIYYNTGSVAIGSSQAPTSTLDVTGTGAFSDDVTVGTSKLVVDVSASRVGVNKAAPGYTLDVDGDINFTGNLTQNGSAYGGSGGGGSGGGGVWTEITGTTTDIHYSSGNVGVANSSPQHTLSVGSNLYVEDTGSNVLVVDGNVACTQLTLGQFEIVPSYGLDDVTAESNVTTDTVELNNATTGLSTVSNVVVGGELTVSGNAAVSSNLTVSGNATVSSNLTVSGNTLSGNATVSSALTVNGHIHQEDGRWKFDFENRRPARLTPTTEFRYVVVQGTSDLPSGSQPNTKYVIPDSGTTVYQYTPSTDTTTTLISSTSSADTVGSIALTTGTEIFTTGAKPFVLSTPAYNHTVIPFVCKGYYFGFTNNRYAPTTIFMYAPYEDVTVNLYLDKSITETPTETFTLTKQTVTTRSINPSVDDYSYTIEAVNGVIMASRKGQDSDATLPNGDHEILYPASNLGYNMTSSNASYYNHDVFNTGGSDEGRWRFSSGVVQTGPTFYSPAGIPHFSSCSGDGDGGDTTGIIPHEIVGEVYYIPHIIPGFMIGYLTNRQSVTVDYYHGGTWYNAYTLTGPRYGVSAYNCIPYRAHYVGAKLDGGRSALSGNMLTSTLWKFTSDHPFVLRMENDEQATDGLSTSAVNGWDEYMAVGWLNSSRTTPIYKPPCFTTPVMYETNLVSGINVNDGTQDSWVEKNIFTEDNNSFNKVYGGGFSTYGSGSRIIVPAPGFYRCTATVYLYRTDGVSARTSTEIRFSNYNGSGTGPVGEGYIREYEDHDDTSISITSIVSLTNADWNSGSTDRLPHIGLLFRRSGSITEGVYTNSASSVILELIR